MAELAGSSLAPPTTSPSGGDVVMGDINGDEIERDRYPRELKSLSDLDKAAFPIGCFISPVRRKPEELWERFVNNSQIENIRLRNPGYSLSERSAAIIVRYLARLQRLCMDRLSHQIPEPDVYPCAALEALGLFLSGAFLTIDEQQAERRLNDRNRKMLDRRKLLAAKDLISDVTFSVLAKASRTKRRDHHASSSDSASSGKDQWESERDEDVSEDEDWRESRRSGGSSGEESDSSVWSPRVKRRWKRQPKLEKDALKEARYLIEEGNEVQRKALRDTLSFTSKLPLRGKRSNYSFYGALGKAVTDKMKFSDQTGESLSYTHGQYLYILTECYQPSRAQAAGCIRLFLSQTVASVYDALPKRVQASVVWTWTRLFQMYESKARQRVTKEQLQRSRWEQSKESLEEYFDKVMRTAQRRGCSDDLTAYIFRSGLPKPLQELLDRETDASSPHDLLAHALRLNDVYIQKQSRQVMGRTNTGAKVIRAVDAWETAETATEAVSAVGNYDQDNNGEEQVAVLMPWCSFCRRTGHRTAECRQRRTPESTNPSNTTIEKSKETAAPIRVVDSVSTVKNSGEALEVEVADDQFLEQSVWALVDSGASSLKHNVVSWQALSSLGRANVQSEPNLKAVSADGSPLALRGVIHLNLELVGTQLKYHAPCLVVEGLTAPVILGMAFIRAHVRSVDVQENVLWVYGQHADEALRVNCRSLAAPENSGPKIQRIQVESSDLEPDHIAVYHMNEKNQEESISGEEGIPMDVLHPKSLQSTEESLRNVPLPEHLSSEQSEQLRGVLLQYSDVFQEKLGRVRGVAHEIRLKPGTKPICARPYRLSSAERQAESEQLEALVQEGIIEPAITPWGFPSVLVRKKDGSFRLTTDFRRLNAVVERDHYPLPLIDSILDELQGAQWFITLDLRSGFWQVALDEESRQIAAIISFSGVFRYKVLPMGLSNSPSAFQRMMDLVLSGLKYKGVLVYIDDVTVYARTFKELLARLTAVLQRFREFNLRVKLEKCIFAVQQVEFLGFLVGVWGIRPSEKIREKIMNWPEELKTTQAVQQFLGIANYIRRFIPGFSAKVTSLRTILKGFEVNLKKRGKNDSINNHSIEALWKKEHSEAVRSIKEALVAAPILQFVDPEAKLIVETDASLAQIGAVLAQVKGDSRGIVAYASRVLSGPEQRYSTTEREALAIVWAVTHWRHYLMNRQFIVVTDHQPLVWLLRTEGQNTRLLKWSLKLSEYFFEVVYRPGPMNVLADALSRIPIQTIYSRTAENQEQWWTQFAPQSDWIQAATADDKYDVEKLRRRELARDGFDVVEDEHGLMWRLAKLRSDGDASKNEVRRVWLIVPNDSKLHEAIIRKYHESYGHPGVMKTVLRIQEVFVWERLVPDVEWFVRACVKCQEHQDGQPSRPIQAPLHPIQATRRNQLVSIDILGAGITTRSGHQYLLVMVDSFTKYSEVQPMTNKSSALTADLFRSNWILRHGAPESILTDNGPEFIGSTMRGVCRVLGIPQLYTTSHHPQGNGQAERTNRTILTLLRGLIQQRHDNWDLTLPTAVWIYNTSVHSATGFTPYFMMYGQEATDFLVWSKQEYRESTAPEETDFFVDQFVRRLNEVRQLAIQKLTTARDAYTRKFASRVKQEPFKVGDIVWLWYPQVSNSRWESNKLVPKWRGPYKIIRLIHDYNVIVSSLDGAYESRVHVNRLRKERYPLLYVTSISEKTQDDELASVPQVLASAYWKIRVVTNWRRYAWKNQQSEPTYEFEILWYGGQKREWIHEQNLPMWIVGDFVALFTMARHPLEERESEAPVAQRRKV